MRLPTIPTLLVCSILLISLAGCPSPDQPIEPRVKYTGEINATEDRFEMDGQFYASTGNDYVYENVTLYLSHANGSLIEGRQLGTLDETISVSVAAEEIPAYVYVDSPDFWKQDNFAVYYYEYRGGEGVQYRQEWAESRSELPINRSTADND